MRSSTMLVLVATVAALAACGEQEPSGAVGGGGAGGAGSTGTGALGAGRGGTGGREARPMATDSGTMAPVARDAEIANGGGGAPDASSHGNDAAVIANDAAIDSGASASTCAFEATLSTRCTASVCTYDGDPFVAVRTREPLPGAALTWSASLCERLLGGSRAGNTDGTLRLYGLTLEDLRVLEAGAPVFIYYGRFSDPPTMEAEECPVERTQEIPECPETETPPSHISKGGCRGPLDTYCAACQVEPNLYLTSTGGADWYDSSITSIVRPAGCIDPGYCLSCASCTYRDEEEASALEERPECEPCPTEAGVDSCFDPSSCDCWCSTRSRLRAACPTEVP